MIKYPSSDATRAAASAATEASAAQRNVAQLEDRLDRMTLLCCAMWELVKEKTALTEDDLVARAAILDAADGLADGKMTAKVLPCPSCQRPMNARARKCIYCGKDKEFASVWETV